MLDRLVISVVLCTACACIPSDVNMKGVGGVSKPRASARLVNVRIAIKKGGAYSINVNGKETTQIEAEKVVLHELNEKMTSRDLMIVTFDSAVPKDKQPVVGMTWRQRAKTFAMERPTVRFIDVAEHDVDLTRFEVLWWSTPYDNPRDQDGTNYLINYKNIGVGQKGFRDWIKAIDSLKENAVVLTHNEYDNSGGFSIGEIPFSEQQEEIIRDSLRKSKKVVIDFTGAMIMSLE